MTCLLDTHALIWSIIQPDNLSDQAVSAIEHTGNTVLASAISFWEISLKHSLNKLKLGGINPHEFPQYALQAGFELLQLSPEEASSYHELSGDWHRDPFDRMLIWQAMRHNMVLVSGDREIWKYREEGLKILW